jgi:hypothetical protein
MKSTVFASLAAIAAQQVAAHATWQELWVNGVDLICYPVHTLLALHTDDLSTEPLVFDYQPQTHQSRMCQATI